MIAHTSGCVYLAVVSAIFRLKFISFLTFPVILLRLLFFECKLNESDSYATKSTIQNSSYAYTTKTEKKIEEKKTLDVGDNVFEI